MNECSGLTHPLNKDGVDLGRVLDAASEAGRILLENGAEISRVEETMLRISHAFGANTEDFFVLTNGIFTTGGDPIHRQNGVFAKVQHIPVKGTQLNKIEAINQLSRETEAGKYTIDELEAEIERIRKLPAKPLWAQLLGAAFGCACFCFLFKGHLPDCIVTFFAAFLLQLYYSTFAAKHLSKLTANLTGGMLVTIVCIACYLCGFGTDLHPMIIGSIFPLIPGVPFTNSIRDITDGHYISGMVRMMDALLVFLCVAVGVAVVFSVYGWLTGGVLL